ncbi:MAG TPA: histidine phosphatase family protein, partial [Ktedonobacteraceae bacterium]
FPLDLIVTSSYARSKQTAKTTISSFQHILRKEWPVQEFTFLSLNPTKSSTINERRPHVDEYWNTRSPSYVDGLEVESFEQFINRASQVMMDLKGMKEYKTIAVFSHVQFICALLWLSQRDPVNLSRETMQEFRKFLKVNWLVNGAIVRVQFDNSNEPWQGEIITSHMENQEVVSLG